MQFFHLTLGLNYVILPVQELVYYYFLPSLTSATQVIIWEHNYGKQKSQ